MGSESRRHCLALFPIFISPLAQRLQRQRQRAPEIGDRVLHPRWHFQKEDSDFILPQVTEQDVFAVERIKASGLDYTFVCHPPFLENIALYLGGDILENGVHAPAGEGKAGFASRDDLAEAHAVVLTQAGHENKTYLLHGDPAVSLADVAQIVSGISGKPVPYVAGPDQDFIGRLRAAGLPAPAADFILAWVRGINAGEWDGASGDLEKLLGRKPVTAAQSLRADDAQRQA